MKLNEKNYTRREIEAYTNNMKQIAEIKEVELLSTRGRGNRQLEVSTGSGFTFTVSPDRGMDITRAAYCGKSMCYVTPNGETNPAFYDRFGNGWVRNFSGGMVATCGLNNVGVENEYEGKHYGLHGTYSCIPADEVSYKTYWDGDDYILEINGKIIDGVMFGDTLVVERKITAKAGENFFTLTDNITNISSSPAPIMLLYHCNFGFPLISENTTIEIDSDVRSRDADAEKGINTYSTMDVPTENYAEQVFDHRTRAAADGTVIAKILNPDYKVADGAYLKYNKNQLPVLVEWKQMGFGSYVLGIEPANAFVSGFTAAKTGGELEYIEPGQTKTYGVEIGIL